MRSSKLLRCVITICALALPAHSQEAVEVDPGEDLQALVDEHPPGTEFLLRGGIHREQQVRPRDGDSFRGEPGAVMSGAQVLPGWRHEPPYWTHSGIAHQGQVHGHCTKSIPDYQGCAFPEDLFLNEQPLWRETELRDLDLLGEWFFDYDRDKIYILDNPEGALVEISVARHAFHGAARGVTIQGLTIEKYAAPAQHGAVHGMEGTFGPLSTDWVVKNNVIRHNHGMGVRTGNGMQVSGNRLIANGQLGIGGSGADILIESNTISRNNYAGFDAEWEAGGSKWVLTEGLTVRGNVVEKNRGPGLWTDTDNIGVLYESNTVRENTHAGIFHEISQGATIRHNVVEKNGEGFDVWLWGAQILISSSRDVEVHDNIVVVGRNGGNGITLVQQERGFGSRGPYLTVNNDVHHNQVTYLGDAGLTGADADHDPEAMYDGDNLFESNRYLIQDLAQSRWAWQGIRDWPAWQAAGQDAGGSVELAPPPRPACGLLGIELLLIPALVAKALGYSTFSFSRKRQKSAARIAGLKRNP